MDQYIKQLISQQPRVIVPDLGAFVASPDAGVMFNQYLSFDDSALVNYVSQQENISADEARGRISEYVKSAKQTLSSGNSLTIDGVGVIANIDGRYEFTANDDLSSGDAQADTAAIDLAGTASAATPVETPKAAEPVAAEPKVVTNNTYVYEEDNKRRNIIIIAIIALLFLIGVILCLFVINKDNCVYNFFFGGEKTEQVVQKPVVKEPVAEPEPVVEPEPEKANIPSERRYNIIVGTYKNEKAAQARVDQLKAKGFENAAVGSFRGDYVAIIDSFDRLPDAEARQEYIVDNYRIESYITNSGE